MRRGKERGRPAKEGKDLKAKKTKDALLAKAIAKGVDGAMGTSVRPDDDETVMTERSHGEPPPSPPSRGRTRRSLSSTPPCRPVPRTRADTPRHLTP